MTTTFLQLIFVKIVDANKTISFDFEAYYTIDNVKALIAMVEGNIPADKQNLVMQVCNQFFLTRLCRCITSFS